MPYQGMPTDRRIRFDERDYELIKNKIPELQYLSARVSQTATISYGEEYGSWSMDGVSQDAAYINNLQIKSGDGRFLNTIDINSRRKVIVISPEMKRVCLKTKTLLANI